VKSIPFWGQSIANLIKSNMKKSNDKNKIVTPFRVYISGKMSNVNVFVYERYFYNAEHELKENGFEVINPVTLGKELDERIKDRKPTYTEYLNNDLDALATCDGIYMLRSWRSSKGARIERIYAQETGKFIAYEPIS
jgi:hypothetical protein